MNLSPRAALAGVAAAGVAIGVAEIVAVLTGPLSSPLLAVGGVVVDTVPGPVKDVGIAVFGTHDKTALIVGTVILLCGYAALLGVVAVRSRAAAFAGVALFGVIGVTAAVTRHDAGFTAALPSIVAMLVAALALYYLVRLAVTADPAPAAPAATMVGRWTGPERRRTGADSCWRWAAPRRWPSSGVSAAGS